MKYFNEYSSRHFLVFVSVVLASSVLLTVGCSSAPPTQYYQLDSDTLDQRYSFEDPLSLGIAAVKIPDSLDRIGIVTQSGRNLIQVSSYQIWAGDLEDSMTRVLADAVAQLTGQNSVWAAPWNTRNRPEYQVQVVIETFSGSINGDAELRLSYEIAGEQGRKPLLNSRYHQSISAGSDYAGYVAALNQLLLDFADHLAADVAAQINRS